MATKKASNKKAATKTTKVAKSDANPREIIAKYDCLQFHVKLLTVLSGLILVSVIVLMVILMRCDDCNKTSVQDTGTGSSSETVEEVEE